MNIYTLTQQQRLLISQLEALEFDEQTIADTLEGEQSTDDLRSKRLAYVAIIKSKEAMIDARDKAIDAINKLRDADELTVARLEKALMSSMIATGDKELIGIEFEAHVQGKPPSVQVYAAEQVPACFWRTPEPTQPKPVIDKAAVKAKLLAGELVEGCILGSNKKLVIK